jgi:hypothetical protein
MKKAFQFILLKTKIHKFPMYLQVFRKIFTW